MNYFKVKSYAKINLALNVIGKKKDFHKIESIVSFLNFYDEILIKKSKINNHQVKFTGNFSSFIKPKNTVSKLLKILDEKKLIKHKYQIIIKKNIPSKAGLGGGSMNAAAILNFFLKKNKIKLSNKEIIGICDLIGFDVKLGIYSKNLIIRSDNSIKSISIKKRIFLLIVKPNFGCSTKKIYSKVSKYSKAIFNRPNKHMFSLKFLKNMKNDLELIAINQYQKLNSLKNFLEKLHHVEFVRMTGSGSSFIAYFNSDIKCKDAEKKVKKQFKNYWCKTSKTI